MSAWRSTTLLEARALIVGGASPSRAFLWLDVGEQAFLEVLVAPQSAAAERLWSAFERAGALAAWRAYLAVAKLAAREASFQEQVDASSRRWVALERARSRPAGSVDLEPLRKAVDVEAKKWLQWIDRALSRARSKGEARVEV